MWQSIKNFFIHHVVDSFFKSFTGSAALGGLILALDTYTGLNIKYPTLAIAALPVGFSILFTSNIIRGHYFKKYQNQLKSDAQIINNTIESLNKSLHQRLHDSLHNATSPADKKIPDWKAQLKDPKVLARLQDYVVHNNHSKAVNVITGIIQCLYAGVGTGSAYFVYVIVDKVLNERPDNEALSNTTLSIAAILGAAGLIHAAIHTNNEWQAYLKKKQDVIDDVDQLFTLLKNKKNLDSKLSAEALAVLNLWGISKNVEAQTEELQNRHERSGRKMVLA